MPRLTSPQDLSRLATEAAARFKARARTVAVCSGTGCLAGKAGACLEALATEVEKQGLAGSVAVRRTGCFGFCERGPIVVVLPEDICYLRVQPADAAEIVGRTLREGQLVERLLFSDGGQPLRTMNEIPFYRRQIRRVLRNCGVIDPEDAGDALARGAYQALVRAFELGPQGVLAEVERAGLRGRGGAGFPTFKKWQLCRAQRADQRYLIANADEGDPGAFMNRSLLEGDPHAVLEGMIIAGYAIGASRGFIYCRAEYPVALHRLTLAIAELRELGLLGENILGSGFAFDVAIQRGAGAFVCGEETALIASIEGRRGMPRPRPPYPVEHGLWGKPTVINNVETLGSVPLVLRAGAKEYASLGSAASKGTKTFSLTGKIRCTGLIEVPLGTTLRQIVEDIGGGSSSGKPIKAVQTGGPSGGCIPAAQLDVTVDYESLSKAGSMMGSGGMVVLDEDTCIVDLAKYFITFTQSESCGKCPPCRVGTRAMLQLLERISDGKARLTDLQRLEELADTVVKASLCGLGQTAPNPVLTTLRYFRDEYQQHIEHGQCDAFVCRNLVRFHIDAERCTGCGACAKICPADAIAGAKKEPHTIDQRLCTQCGSCRTTCPATYAAIYRTSGKLTRYDEIQAARAKGEKASKPEAPSRA